MDIQHSYQGRSLFWPFLLIGVGVVWLFSNLGILQPASLGVLFRLWPLVLIVIGVNLLFGRRSPALGNLIGVGAVVVIIGLMLVGPSLGWAQAAEVKTANYSEPMGDVQSAQVHLDLAVAESNVTALSDSDNLFEADLNYTGELVYDVTGEGEKVITLSERDQFNQGFNFWDWNFWDNDAVRLRWDIALNPTVPLDLQVSSGVGDSNLDLSELQLTSLNINSGVGSMNLSLPAVSDSYAVTINGGAGSMDIQIIEGTMLNLDINGGVGEVIIDVPDGAAVRVEASTGVGAIEVPANYQQIDGDESDFVGERGVWQSDDFENSNEQITIEFDGGVGSLIIR